MPRGLLEQSAVVSLHSAVFVSTSTLWSHFVGGEDRTRYRVRVLLQNVSRSEHVEEGPSGALCDTKFLRVVVVNDTHVIRLGGSFLKERGIKAVDISFRSSVCAATILHGGHNQACNRFLHAPRGLQRYTPGRSAGAAVNPSRTACPWTTP